MKSWIPDARNFAYLTWKQVEALPKEATLLVLPTVFAIVQRRASVASPTLDPDDPGFAGSPEVAR